MCSKQVIKECLDQLEYGCICRAGWAQTQYETWYEALITYSDSTVENATKRWQAEKERVPTLAGFRTMLKTMPGSAPQDPDGCRECQWSGWRHVAIHTSVSDCAIFAATCDCNRGLFYTRGTVLSWRDLTERARKKGHTVYSTSARTPSLPPQWAMSTNAYEAWRARERDPRAAAQAIQELTDG